MFKKSIIASVVFMCALQAHAACVIHSESPSSKIGKMITASAGWTFNNYEEICRKVNAANAEIVILGNSTVLENKSIAWASISIKDRNLPIYSNAFSGVSTMVNSYASQDQADKMLMEAVNNAIENLVIDKAVMTLDRARKEVKTAYGK